MARRTKEEALETRKAIIDAAVRVFAVRGISTASLTDIAVEAGVTRGAIYWHFANKGDLLNSLLDQFLEYYTPLTEASESEDEPDPLGKLEELYLSFLGCMDKNPLQKQMFQILFTQEKINRETEVLRLRHQKLRLERFRGVQIVLRNAVKRGQLAPNFDIDAGTTTIFSMVHGLISNWILNPELVDITRQGPIVVRGVFTLLRANYPEYCHH